jgi:hypothetical protein
MSAEQGKVLEQIVGSVRNVKTPDCTSYTTHGVELIPVNFLDWSKQGIIGTYVIDLSPFKTPKFAWLKHLTQNGFDVVVSDGRQTPPQQAETYEELARRHGELLMLENGEEKIAVTVRYFDIEKGLIPYRPTLLHLPANWQAPPAETPERKFPL